jgi:serine/threonine protein phosphatase PrpC
MSLRLRYAARSDRGLIREGNEDSVYAGPRLLAVADGMGGMAAGEVASNIVVAALAPLDEDAPGADLVDALKAAIFDANQQLRAAVESNSSLEGMGTTLTAMLFSGTRIGLVHVGDSRAYVMRDGELTQITRDDTYVQMLVDEGRITEDEAATHPQRSLLTRALTGLDLDPEFSVREAQLGERYLLCSDGLSSVVSAETMAEALLLDDPRQAADRLIALALRGGGPDNITCIVADVVAASGGDDEPVVGGAAARDRGRTSSASADSAAGRAALARPQPDEEPEEPVEEPSRKRRPIRTFLLLVLGVVLIAGGGVLGWGYVQHQYYVGATSDGHVAVFRGIRGSVAGLRLSDVDSQSDLGMDELPIVVRNQVGQGIPAQSRGAALSIVRNLLHQSTRCAPSPTPSASPVPGPSPTPTPMPSDCEPGSK